MTLKKKYTKEYDKYLSDGLRVWLNYFIELNHFPQTSSFCKRFTVTDFDTTDVIKCKKCFEKLCSDEVAIYRGYRDPDNLFRNVMVWLLCERGCQFYPHKLKDEFKCF